MVDNTLLARRIGAIRDAVNDALAQVGARYLDLPTTPERVWQAIRGART